MYTFLRSIMSNIIDRTERGVRCSGHRARVSPDEDKSAQEREQGSSSVDRRRSGGWQTGWSAGRLVREGLCLHATLYREKE